MNRFSNPKRSQKVKGGISQKLQQRDILEGNKTKSSFSFRATAEVLQHKGLRKKGEKGSFNFNSLQKNTIFHRAKSDTCLKIVSSPKSLEKVRNQVLVLLCIRKITFLKKKHLLYYVLLCLTGLGNLRLATCIEWDVLFLKASSSNGDVFFFFFVMCKKMTLGLK